MEHSPSVLVRMEKKLDFTCFFNQLKKLGYFSSGDKLLTTLNIIKDKV